MGVHDLTFLFEEDSTFCNDYRYVPINVALALFVRKGNGDVGVFDADFHWNTEYADGSLYCFEKTC